MDLEVSVKGLELNETLRNVVVRQVRAAVERFGDRVNRVQVRFIDLNGPRGGIDTRCRIQAEVHPLGTVVVQDTHETAFQAIASAAEKFTRTTTRRLDRQRLRRSSTLEGTTV
ncbi:MAG: HPF/RaiA family ribosome-associated protein [Planctomycetota bacterium]